MAPDRKYQRIWLRLLMDIQEQKKLAKLAIEASYCGGLEIMKIYANDFEVEIKEDNSPLTLADKNANDVITRFLEKNRPSHSK